MPIKGKIKTYSFVLSLIWIGKLIADPVDLNIPLFINSGETLTLGEIHTTSNVGLPYELRYENGRKILLLQSEYDELKALIKHYADKDKQYNILRNDGTYEAATPNYLIVHVSSGKLKRYEVDGATPFFASINYGSKTPTRNARGQIVLTEEDRAWDKTVPILKKSPGKPWITGEVPSIEQVLEADMRGNNKLQRFAVDFGEQGLAWDHIVSKRLVPIAVVGSIEKEGKKFAVFIPVDRYEDYKKGKIDVNHTYMVPQSALLYIDSQSQWNELFHYYYNYKQTKEHQGGFFKVVDELGDSEPYSPVSLPLTLKSFLGQFLLFCTIMLQ